MENLALPSSLIALSLGWQRNLPVSVQLDVTAGGRGEDVTLCLLWCITGGSGEGDREWEEEEEEDG